MKTMNCYSAFWYHYFLWY